jgi:hypothetical protein
MRGILKDLTIKTSVVDPEPDVVTYGLNLAGSGFALVIKSLDPEPPH